MAALQWYNVAKHNYSIEDLAGMTLKVALASALTFNADDANVGAITWTEFSGSGYTGGYGGADRRTIANLAAEQESPLHRSKLTGDRMEWGNLNSASVTHILILLETGGSDATSIPIAAGQAPGLPWTADGKYFYVRWADSGILHDWRDPLATPPAGKKYEANNRVGHKYSLQEIAGETLFAILMDADYLFDPNHDFVADVVANEVSGSGYSRQTLAGVASNQDDANDRAELDCDNPAFGPNLDVGDVGGVYICIQRTTDADHELVCYVSGGGFPVATDGSGTLTVTINAEGILHDV